MSYSPSLQYFLERMEGLSTGIFRLETQNQTSFIAPQSIIRFTLPSNSLVDMHSFGFHFSAKTSAGGPTSAQRLPAKIESLINRVEVSVGGVSVSSGCNFYNVLCHALSVVDGGYDDAGMDHPEIITTGAANNYVDGKNLVNNEQPSTNNNDAQFCISKWKGFLGECQPRVIDTSLLGDIVVTFFLEQAGLSITNSAGVTAAAFVGDPTGTVVPSDYTLNNVYASIRCYSLANGVYDNMIADQMSRGPLEVGFKQYFSFRDNNNGSMRYTVATQSLDRLIVATHNDNGTIPGNKPPILVAGHNAIGSTAADRMLDLQKPHYLQQYADFTEPDSASKNLYEWTLNGAKYPQYRATAEDLLRITRLASNTGWRSETIGLEQYKKNFFVSAIKLTLDAPNARFCQGLDTRSVSLNGYYNVYNQSGSRDVSLFAETTSSLMIGVGRQIEVIQ